MFSEVLVHLTCWKAGRIKVLRSAKEKGGTLFLGATDSDRLEPGSDEVESQRHHVIPGI